jgi:hypothetical protein
MQMCIQPASQPARKRAPELLDLSRERIRRRLGKEERKGSSGRKGCVQLRQNIKTFRALSHISLWGLNERGEWIVTPAPRNMSSQ